VSRYSPVKVGASPPMRPHAANDRAKEMVASTNAGTGEGSPVAGPTDGIRSGIVLLSGPPSLTRFLTSLSSAERRVKPSSFRCHLFPSRHSLYSRDRCLESWQRRSQRSSGHSRPAPPECGRACEGILQRLQAARQGRHHVCLVSLVGG